MRDLMGKERTTDFGYVPIENILIDAPIFDYYEKMILFKLIRHAYGRGKNSAYPSKENIALCTGISKGKVKTVLKGLAAKEYLWAEERKENNCYLPTLYYWDKEKILKDCVISCLENNLCTEQDIPKVWMDAINVELKIQDIQKGVGHGVTEGRSWGDQPLGHGVTDLSEGVGHGVTEGRSWGDHKEDNIIKQSSDKKKKGRNRRKEGQSEASLVFLSSPVSDETENPTVQLTGKERLQQKALERVQERAEKVKGQLEGEGYRREELNKFFDEDIAKRFPGRIHFLDPTAPSHKKLLLEGKDEWQFLINKFTEKHFIACPSCGKDMRQEYCEECTRQPYTAFLPREEDLNEKEKEFRQAQEKFKDFYCQEKTYSSMVAENPHAEIFAKAAKKEVQKWSEKLLKLCSSANECEDLLWSLRQEVEKDFLSV